MSLELQKITPKPLKRVSTKKYRGAGDLIARVAEPIAAASDAVFNTKLKGCQACQKRRDKLNKFLPLP